LKLVKKSYICDMAKKILITIILFCVVTISCKKHDLNEPPHNNTPTPCNPTPYPLEIPYYFGMNDTVQQRLAYNPLTVEGVELGRHLFYDSLLSENYTISCGSCHVQKYGFSDPRRYSTGTQGQIGKRNAMALVNLLWTRDFFWDGRVKTLEEQVLHPIQDPNEMNMNLDVLVQRLQNSPKYREMFKKAFCTETIDKDKIAKALAQFVHSLISKDSKFDKYLRGEIGLTYDEREGLRLFQTHPIPNQVRGGNCGDCHFQPHFDGKNFKNNGIDSIFTDVGYQNVTHNPFDVGKFKVVTLRNIAVTAPYMHDGRFNTLEEVLEHYDKHVKLSEFTDPLIMEASNVNGGAPRLYLYPHEINQILAFLKTLTDTTFLNNPKFSNPFIK